MGAEVDTEFELSGTFPEGMLVSIFGSIHNRDGILCVEGKEFEFRSSITESAANFPPSSSSYISQRSTHGLRQMCYYAKVARRSWPNKSFSNVGEVHNASSFDQESPNARHGGFGFLLTPSQRRVVYMRLLQTETDIFSYQEHKKLDEDIRRSFGDHLRC